MGGDTNIGMMVGMAAISFLVPYAAGAWATAIGGVAPAATGGVTVMTSGVSNLVSTLASISQMNPLLLAGSAVATQLAGDYVSNLPAYDDYNSGYNMTFYEPKDEPSYEYTGFEQEYLYEGLDPDFTNYRTPEPVGFNTIEQAGSPTTNVPLFGATTVDDPFGTAGLEAGQVIPEASEAGVSFGEYGQLDKQEEEFSDNIV